MDQYLVPIANVKDTIKDSYVIYDVTGGIYYCKHVNWQKFSQFFTRTTHKHHFLCMDLCYAVTHALIFDIDITYKCRDDTILIQKYLNEYLEKILSTYIKTFFISKTKTFTCIMGFRENGGIHLHFPEMEIAYDDYIQLCNELIPLFKYDNEVLSCKLDVVQNIFLTACGKPKTNVYFPSRIYFYDELNSFVINVSQPDTFKNVQASFKKHKDNMKSFFRKLLMIPTFEDMVQLASEFMMPVMSQHKPLHYLVYKTIINSEPELKGNEEIIAQFKYRTNETQYIHKNSELNFTGGQSWLKSFNYISHSAVLISDLQSTNQAIRRWFNMYNCKVELEEGIFQEINTLLRQDNLAFVNDSNPLKTILNFNNGYYFLPVFYALIKYLNIQSRQLVQHLRVILDNSDLLNRLEDLDEGIIQHIAKDFTINTILYCGSNLHKKPTSMKDKINLVIHSMKDLLYCVSNTEQMVDHIKRIQERHFPIVMINTLNSCKKSTRLMWNFINECWQDIMNQSDVTNLINTIWSGILTYLKSNLAYDLKCINIGLIVSMIMTETTVEQKELEMDRHRWHLRIHEGIFDLLTGHLSGTVPEFYISNRKMGVHFDDIMQLRTRPDLIFTYQLLVDKQFFLKYLKAIFDDMTDDLFDTCREVFCEHGGTLNTFTESMLKFYVHFCKYTSFEYDVMIYMLDVVSSILIATNYGRKFFVFKGNTRNGKSKFFQMLSKVFGGYSHTIRSINLQAGNYGLQAQPELATSIFSCRIVTVEELSGKLNENMIKELTGNSSVSFRKLYEQSQGGIPTSKIFASTNSLPSCTATEAFKDRIVAIPFEAIFTNDLPSTTSEQVEQGKYKLDTGDSVIEDSYEGFFIFIYHHFLNSLNMETGTIEYRKEPDALVEYKEQFLIMTDIFSQFQQYMDIQIVPGCITSIRDVKSAIRHFLKQTHNSSWDENELLIRFHSEYKHLRYQETDLNSYCPLPDDYEYDENEEEISQLDTQIEPVAKKSKMEEKIIIYRNIQIKNLRKERR